MFVFTNNVTQKMLVSGTVNYFKCSHNKTVNVQWGKLKTSGILMPQKHCNFINTCKSTVTVQGVQHDGFLMCNMYIMIPI